MTSLSLLVGASIFVALSEGALLSKISTKMTEEGYRVLVDAEGRERFFHGVNTVVKGPPYVPSRGAYDPKTSVVKEDFEMMKASGVNWIRLGVMWAGAEPARGQYNRTYFDTIREISEEAATYGIYTLADMHQDVLSERYCGEGIPFWATPDIQEVPFPVPVGPLPYHNDPSTKLPTRQDCAKHAWPSLYGTEACGAAFEHLYTHLETVDAWGKFWREVAETYKGSPNLLGYELINEPYVGNPFVDPELLTPGVADEERLQPAYDVLNGYIRSVDTEGLVFFAGATWDRTGGPIVDNLPWGFKHAPGGDAFANRSVNAFHYYTPPQNTADNMKYFETRKKDAVNLKTAMFLTETFAWRNGGGALTNAESLGLSWGGWEWKDFCKETPATLNSSSQYAAFGACKTGYGGVIPDTGSPSANLETLARTYAPAVAGRFVTSNFNITTGDYSLTFKIDTRISLPTEVFYYPERYPGAAGPSVTVQPPNSLQVQKVGNNLLHFRPQATATQGQIVTISIAKQH
eukprot:TRINITY_DN565_c0_g1_i1.p1 TRINITY_DN565_c0_g1~~TRINITY_DN565_c0_g1_i1.p1  ORF type:complete len:533 (+),score=159.24 TRINITY_DN565_c0_g1_i1:48-1601(+)